jgi:hypothetical protein
LWVKFNQVASAAKKTPSSPTKKAKLDSTPHHVPQSLLLHAPKRLLPHKKVKLDPPILLPPVPVKIP